MNPFEMKTDGKVCPKCGGTNTEDNWSCPDDHGLIIIHNWRCKDCGWDDAAMTNGDKIRKMSDEELARYICRDLGIPCAHCPVDNECGLLKGSYGALTDWLKHEAKDE